MADAGEQWAVVYEPFQELKSEGPWEIRRAEFVGKLPDAQDPAIGAFLTHLDELPESRRADLLRTEEADTVLYGYLEEYSSSESEESDGADDGAGDAWAGFLATNVPYWDGEEDTWEQFREWFGYEAHQQGFGVRSDALFAELDTQDVDSRIATFGREGGTVAKRKNTEPEQQRETKKRKTEVPEDEEEGTGSGARRSGRLAVKKKEALARGVKLKVNTVLEGTQTQHLDQVDNIGFHMLVTLEVAAGGPAIDTLYTLHQYVQDAYDRGPGDTQDLSDWEEDEPFCPPYAEDGTVTVTPVAIQFDDHPGFSTGSRIDAGQWLHSYQVNFYWVVTRLEDGAQWSSEQTDNSVESTYADGDDADVEYTASGHHEWDVTFG